MSDRRGRPTLVRPDAAPPGADGDRPHRRATAAASQAGRVGLPGTATCPFCGRRETEPMATFGSLLMTSQYYCRPCRSTFEWVRREEG